MTMSNATKILRNVNSRLLYSTGEHCSFYTLPAHSIHIQPTVFNSLSKLKFYTSKLYLKKAIMSGLNQIAVFLFVFLITTISVICHEQPNPFMEPSSKINHSYNPRNKLLNPVGERKHIMEHMEVTQNTSTMNEDELQFHYFKMWDLDHNNKLDGCELMNVVIHQEGHGSDHNNSTDNALIKILKDEELSILIDPILHDHDEDQDGMIDYYEYMLALDYANSG
ncbi:Multiple coagulation factor deficiency protein 2 [Orchesella cincta]|uniref:Multiple coagulation factor deficiency protein 2 n=1 Tax=Orchesella cincta TaxID=48709 RepID=A0A1D2MPD2_ORCCI|nr:Multiple coagulation factor deficiency protein 2 [Orchesella cincta]